MAHLTSALAMAGGLARLGPMDNLQDPLAEPTLAALTINEPPGFPRLFASDPPIKARIQTPRAAAEASLLA